MGARDPETGRFVSNGGELMPLERREFGFTDIVMQQWYLHLSVAAGSLGGGTGELGGQNDVWEAPLGGREPLRGNVNRGEVAELLGIELRLAVFPSSTETADGTLEGAWSISREPTFQLHDGDQISTDEGSLNAINAQVIGSGGNPENDVLAHAHSIGFAPFSDGATGVGGSGSTQLGHFEIDYLDKYGSGPLFDREDEFYNHVSLRQWNIDDSAAHAIAYQRFYWVVHNVADIEEQIYESPVV